MSQVTSTSAANGTGLAVRTAINTILEALASLSSGATAPTNTRAGQAWFDTANGVLKIRNAANTGWITLQNTANALSAVAALTPAANRIAYYTSASAAALATLTAFGRSIIAVNDDAAMRSLIGVGANFGATATQTTDWNNATECGSYWSSSADAASNTPNGENSRTWLGSVVAQGVGNLVQQLTPTNANMVYMRRRVGSAWGAWFRVDLDQSGFANSVASAIADAALGSIGSYAFLSANGTYAVGAVVAASALRYASVGTDTTSASPSGSWLCLGPVSGTNWGTNTKTLFKRVA